MGQRHPQYRKPFNASRPRVHRHHRKSKDSFVSTLISSCLVVGAIFFMGAPQMTATWQNLQRTPEERAKVEQSVYYSGCNEARAAGAAPIYAGQPGYRPEMDGDSDGIACEPHY